ncbi:uncharacterized protein KRP23_2258 [Phytophthora ramorum]|uniref:uncharacterized protein n=1 Tax=Phytophthora ramorum TaxID=164328 RepID=UPI0030AEA375|nr:hypothetical protein KRP23_2258 [Phytophthora ramorum]
MPDAQPPSDVEAARLLTGSRTSITSPPRKLLACMPMLVLAALTTMVGMTVVIGAGGVDFGSGNSVASLSSSATFLAADVSVNVSHPDSQWYHRSDGFDETVGRDRGVVTKFMSGMDGNMQYMDKLIANFDYKRFNITGEPKPSDNALKSFAYNNNTCHEMDSSLVLIDKERVGQAAMDVMLWFITEERFRYQFSFGDKETFWLTMEMAHVPYFFSPWGVSVVSSSPNKDMQEHPDTLCGSILQYMPVNDNNPEMLYVNGKALVDPYPSGVDGVATARRQNLYNTFPTHMVPRQKRTPTKPSRQQFTIECMIGLGSTPLPDSFPGALMRRRLHFLGVTTGVLGSLQHCETYALDF